MDNYINQQYVDIIINDVQNALIEYSLHEDVDINKDDKYVTLKNFCGYDLKLRYYILYVIDKGTPRLNINFSLYGLEHNTTPYKINENFGKVMNYFLDRRNMFKINIPVTRLSNVTNMRSDNFIMNLLKKKMIYDLLETYIYYFRGVHKGYRIHVSHYDDTGNVYLYYMNNSFRDVESHFKFKDNFKENKIHETIDNMLEYIDNNTYTVEETELYNEKRNSKKWYQFWI